MPADLELGTHAAAPGSAAVAQLTGWPVQRPPLVSNQLVHARILAPAVLDLYRCSHFRLEAMPGLAQEILVTAHDPRTELIDFVATAQREPAVVAELVRIANSALYRGQVPTATVRDAVIRIGIEESRRVAAAVATRALFRARSERIYALRPTLWDELALHALCTGYGAAWLARRLKAAEPGLAFMAGLFFDIGKTVALHTLLGLLQQSQPPFPVDDDTCRLVLDLVHAEMGSEQLLYFNMPAVVISVCARGSEPSLPAEPRYAIHHVVRLVAGLLELERRDHETPHLAAVVADSVSALKLPPDASTRLHHEMASLTEKVGIILNQPIRSRPA